jgi:hypothetical protein
MEIDGGESNPWLNRPFWRIFMDFSSENHPAIGDPPCHRIGLWENLQESPIFDGKNHGFL